MTPGIMTNEVHMRLDLMCKSLLNTKPIAIEMASMIKKDAKSLKLGIELHFTMKYLNHPYKKPMKNPSIKATNGMTNWGKVLNSLALRFYLTSAVITQQLI